MQYTRLGNSGLVVSRLSFGTMTFTHTPGAGRLAPVAKVDQNSANDITAAAMDGGVNFFNCADVYANGDSEEILGAALGKRRNEAIIATKVGTRWNAQEFLRTGLSRRHILMSIDESLRRLNTDWIDLYLFHKTDPNTPVEEALDAMEQVVRDGKVRYVGVSNWQPWLVAKAVQYQKDRNYQRFVAAEYYYSLMGREIEHDLVPMAVDANIDILPWGPLASGFLSGKYTKDDPGGSGGRRAQMSYPPIDPEKGEQAIALLRQIGAEHDASCPQIALAWLLAKPAVGSVLMSATNLAQLKDNIGAADVKLSPEEMARLDALTAPPAPFLNKFIDMASDTQMAKILAER